ncbi:MAG: Ig-like domain-containing protein [archaeon]
MTGMKNIRILSLMIASMVLVASVVLSTDPSIIGLPNNFTIYEDVRFEYLVTGEDADGDYPLNFSTSTDTATDFPRFNIEYFNATTAWINFTPLNSDVGNGSDKKAQIVVSDSINDGDLYTVQFNIVNVNDPPNITDFNPADLAPVIAENDSLGFQFNYTATDDDLIHVPPVDNLSNSYYFEGSVMTFNLTWWYLPTFCDAGLRNVTLIVMDLYNESDRLMWQVNVTNTNRIPILNQSIQNYTWAEDSNQTGILVLDDYFYDIDRIECTGTNRDNLTYTAYGNSSIRIIINQTTHNVTFVPAPDYFGVETVYFEVSDGTNTTRSNDIILNVTNINDAPVIQSIAPVDAYEWAMVSILINATDADGDDMNFTDDATVFDISQTGFINYTAQEGETGLYLVNISVTDGWVNDSFILTMTVNDNLPPGLDNYATQFLNENTPYAKNFTAEDPDGDNITFFTNSTVITINDFNITTGTVVTTPTNGEVGNHSVRIYVRDSRGAENYSVILFSIGDINNAPILDPIGIQRARVGIEYTKYLPASDADDDTLTWNDNSSFFNVTSYNSTWGMINFTPGAGLVANHTINIVVNDSIVTDYEIVRFEITTNSIPNLSFVPDQNISEDLLYLYMVQASDLDNDSLTFTFNTSLFTPQVINTTTILINFTPDITEVSNHSILINVSDAYGGHIEQVWRLGIYSRNDPPVFEPPLDNMVGSENSEFNAYIIGYDQEEDNMSFGTNSTFFNLTYFNTTARLINFTPQFSQRGNHSVLFNLSDGNSINNTIITFTVIPENNPPTIVATYPSTANFSVSENNSAYLNVTATDIDTSQLFFYWYVDGTLNSSSGNNITWIPRFQDAGTKNITIVVSDGTFNDTFEWNVTVINLNRPPEFGIVRHRTYTDFSVGTYNITNHTPSGIALLANDSGYLYSGTFNATLDLYEDLYQNTSAFFWSGLTPNGTNLTFWVRSSADTSSWGPWALMNYSGDHPEIDDKQYVQYRATLSTTNSSLTPSFDSVETHYQINNLTINEGDIKVWIDLDDYFADPDINDNVTYSYYSTAPVTVTIEDGTHNVLLYSEEAATAIITFSANDGNATGYSNNVTVVFEDIIQTSSPSTGGSGGGSSSSVTITQTRVLEQNRNSTEYLAIEIIVPGLVTIYENETMMVPFSVVNKDNLTFEEIYLSGMVGVDGINISFNRTYIETLKPGESMDNFLYVDAYRTYGSYEISIIANVGSPEYTDIVKFYINSLEKGAENRSQLNTKIAFTQDLLQQNPECLELSELLEQAKEATKNNQFAIAERLIDQTTEGCKYIISIADTDLEIPLDSPGFFHIIGQWFADVWHQIRMLFGSFS